MEQNKDADLSPYNYSHLIFFTKMPKIQAEGKTIFNNAIEKNWMSTCRRMELDFYVHCTQK